MLFSVERRELYNFVYDKVKRIVHEILWFGPDPKSLLV